MWGTRNEHGDTCVLILNVPTIMTCLYFLVQRRQAPPGTSEALWKYWTEWQVHGSFRFLSARLCLLRLKPPSVPNPPPQVLSIRDARAAGRLEDQIEIPLLTHGFFQCCSAIPPQLGGSEWLQEHRCLWLPGPSHSEPPPVCRLTNSTSYRLPLRSESQVHRASVQAPDPSIQSFEWTSGQRAGPTEASLQTDRLESSWHLPYAPPSVEEAAS